MRIFFSPETAGRFGGQLNGNLRYLNRLVITELERAGFTSSFTEFWFQIAYPPMYVGPGVVGMEAHFMRFFDQLPSVRFNRRHKQIHITLKAPEFSENLDKEEQEKYEHKLEIKEEYKNIQETDLAKILIDKYFEALQLIKDKLKPTDVFDLVTFEKVLHNIRDQITPEFLELLTIEQTIVVEQNLIKTIELSRAERRNRNAPKDTPIRDLRLYFSYTLPGHLQYLLRLGNIVGAQLASKEFRCPSYTHLYISIAGIREDALKRTLITEDWFTFGIAVLKEETLLAADHGEHQALLLKAIEDGLLDIAELDGLDKGKILEAISEARKIDVASELPFKAKENKKITFVVTLKPVLGKNEHEVFFTLIDKVNNRVAKWKFGQENIYIIGAWLGTITVTNSFVRTRNRAYTDLALKGKQLCMEIDIEQEFSRHSINIEDIQ